MRFLGRANFGRSGGGTYPPSIPDRPAQDADTVLLVEPARGAGNPREPEMGPRP